MKINYKAISLLIFSSLVFNNSICGASEIHQLLSTKSNVEGSKPWTIIFNRPINEDSAKNNIKVIENYTRKNLELNFYFKENNTKVIIEPKSSYEKGKSYTLYVSSEVKSLNNKNLTTPSKIDFSIINDNFSQNLSSNMSNHSLVADDDVNLYYVGDNGNLFKSMKNKTLSSPIYCVSPFENSVYSINLYNNYIYFCTNDTNNTMVHRIDKDGNNHKILFISSYVDFSSGVQLMGKYLYYYDKDRTGIYRLDITEEKPLSENLLKGNVISMCLKDGFIYYSLNEGGIFKYNTKDNISSSMISKNKTFHMSLWNNCLYYIPANDYINKVFDWGIYSLNLIDGTEKKVSEVKAGNLNVYNDYIFYTRDNTEKSKDELYVLYKMKTDGSDTIKLSDKIYTHFINVIDNYVYGQIIQDYNEIFKLRLDGSGLQILKKNN